MGAVTENPDAVLVFVLDRLEASMQIDRFQLEAMQAIRERLLQHDRQLGELQEQLLALANRQNATDRVVRSLSDVHP